MCKVHLMDYYLSKHTHTYAYALIRMHTYAYARIHTLVTTRNELLRLVTNLIGFFYFVTKRVVTNLIGFFYFVTKRIVTSTRVLEYSAPAPTLALALAHKHYQSSSVLK